MRLVYETDHPRGLKFEEKGLDREHPVRCLYHSSRIPHNIRLHYHDSLEINLLDHMKGRIRLEDRTIPLEGKTLLLIPPGLLHSYRTEPSPGGLFKVWHFSVGDFTYLNTRQIEKMIGKMPGMIRFNPVDEKVMKLLTILEEGSLPARNAAFLNLLSRLTDADGYERTALPAENFLHRAIAFLESHYQNPLSLEDAAEAAKLSKYHFSRKFRDASGSTWSSYLNVLRLEKSLKLLKAGRTVEDTACESGFEDSTYFIRQFKKMYGTTPGQYGRKGF